MEEKIRAYYGAEKLEDAIKAGIIKANYSRNYSRYKAKYDKLVDAFFNYGKSVSENGDGKYIGFLKNSYAGKYIDEGSLSFPEAIADMQAEFGGNIYGELFQKVDDYYTLKLGLFIRFSDTLSCSLNWINNAIVEGVNLQVFWKFTYH